MSEPLRHSLGYGQDLREALEQPELDVFDQAGVSADDHARHAALELATALGFCRLFGASIEPELDGTLPVAIALAACQALVARAERMAQATDNLEQRCDALFQGSCLSATGVELEEMGQDLLEQRMELWAAQVAIDEAYEEGLDAPPQRGDTQLHSLEQTLTSVLDLFDRIDARMQKHANLLACADTRLLDNWRALLVEPFRLVLPWWLDGTLEAACHESEASLASLPDRVAWRGLMQPRAAGHRQPIIIFLLRNIARAWDGSALESNTNRLNWRSADGNGSASLTLPSTPPEDPAKAVVKLIFKLPGQRPGLLAGQPVWIGLAHSTISKGGQASFTLDQLAQAGEEWTLVVGNERAPWEAVASSPEQTGESAS